MHLHVIVFLRALIAGLHREKAAGAAKGNREKKRKSVKRLRLINSEDKVVNRYIRTNEISGKRN